MPDALDTLDAPDALITLKEAAALFRPQLSYQGVWYRASYGCILANKKWARLRTVRLGLKLRTTARWVHEFEGLVVSANAEVDAARERRRKRPEMSCG